MSRDKGMGRGKAQGQGILVPPRALHNPPRQQTPSTEYTAGLVPRYSWPCQDGCTELCRLCRVLSSRLLSALYWFCTLSPRAPNRLLGLKSPHPKYPRVCEHSLNHYEGT